MNADKFAKCSDVMGSSQGVHKYLASRCVPELSVEGAKCNACCWNKDDHLCRARGGSKGERKGSASPPLGQKFFIFMQFSGKIVK